MTPRPTDGARHITDPPPSAGARRSIARRAVVRPTGGRPRHPPSAGRSTPTPVARRCPDRSVRSVAPATRSPCRPMTSSSSSTSRVNSLAGMPNNARAASGCTASWMPLCSTVPVADRGPSAPVGCGSSTGLVCSPPTGIRKVPDRTPSPNRHLDRYRPGQREDHGQVRAGQPAMHTGHRRRPVPEHLRHRGRPGRRPRQRRNALRRALRDGVGRRVGGHIVRLTARLTTSWLATTLLPGEPGSLVGARSGDAAVGRTDQWHPKHRRCSRRDPGPRAAASPTCCARRPSAARC